MKKNILISLALAIFGLSMVTAIVPQRIYAADAEGVWIHSARISIEDRIEGDREVFQIFVDSSPGDGDRTFYVEGENVSEDPNKCVDRFKVTKEDGSEGTVTRRRDRLIDIGCETYETKRVVFSQTLNATKTPEAAAAESEGESCESVGGVLGWILCPVVSVLDAFFNFIDSSIQNLLTVDADKYRDPAVKQTWAAIRNIAYTILIPVMLVMVIGTAIGANFIDAYTAKKALPRLVIAVIFIALSWEIGGFLIGLSNNVGHGVLGIITSPLPGNFGDAVTYKDLTSGSAGSTISQYAILGVGIKAATLTPGFLGILGSFLLTASIIVLTVFLVIIARQLLILAIMIFLPIAIISWIFPGNDKMWKFLWGTFTKLLIMFPIIMALIGMGRVFVFLVDPPGSSNPGVVEDNILNPLIKLAAYIIPYLLIPFAFKAAGGVLGNLMGMVNDKEKGVFDRLRKGRAQKYQRAASATVAKRADWQNAWQKKGSDYKRSWVGRKAFSAASMAIGGENIQAKDSAYRAMRSKELNEQINTGRDDEIRGLSVNKAWALQRGTKATKNADGTWTNGDWRDNDGIREFRTAGGAWVTEGAVDRGHARWGKDTYAQQTALSYEMRKAGTEEELGRVANTYGVLATGKDAAGNYVGGGWGMTDNEAGGAWIGAAFENQNQHLEFKHTDWKTGKMDSNKARAFATEVYEKKGSYPLAQMGGNTIKQLKNAYDVGDEETKKKIQSVAETFMYRGGARGITGVEGEGGEGMPIPDPRPPETPVGATPGGPGGKEAAGRAVPEAFFQTNTPGAAAVAERVRDLAVHVGVYQSDLGSPRTTSDGSPPLGRNLPPPDIPRQN